MELTTETIQNLARIMTNENLTSLVLDQGNLKIEIKREVGRLQPANITVSEPVAVISQPLAHNSETVELESIETPTNGHWKEIKSPMVGIFYQSSQPENPPYVTKGQRFEEGDTLCIIEAMKLMNEITAETPGTIMEVCVGNGQIVEFGQVLYRISED